MKNIFLLLLAAVSILTIASCKKKIENCKLGKSFVSDGATTPKANTFYYDQSDRLQKIVYSRGNKDSLFYSADSIYILSYDNADSLTALFAGVVNASGYVASGRKTSYSLSGSILSEEDYSMEYNAEGNLTQQVTSYPLTSDILQFYYTGGNADSSVLLVSNVRSKSYVFFRGSAENKTGIDDLNGVFMPYLGKASQNLLDSVHIYPAGADSIRIQYAHTLDENEYVSKTVQTYLTSGVNTKYFTYQYMGCEK